MLEQVEDEYEKTRRNIEDLYFKIKTELWSYKLDLSIIDISNSEFYLNINHKSQITNDNIPQNESDLDVQIYLKVVGKEMNIFELTRIELTQAEEIIRINTKKSILESLRNNDFLIFLKQLKK
mmetsp:Transcript_13293/g.11769  ORF Transcript_13293/g.11769 Transcript_13293/m.11769 type:complete len:123 (-) Transcript_13293:86-454(-)